MAIFYEDIPDNVGDSAEPHLERPQTRYIRNSTDQAINQIYEWILTQKMLWVATAPLSAAGHVNVSPKGGEYFGLYVDILSRKRDGCKKAHRNLNFPQN